MNPHALPTRLALSSALLGLCTCLLALLAPHLLALAWAGLWEGFDKFCAAISAVIGWATWRKGDAKS